MACLLSSSEFLPGRFQHASLLLSGHNPPNSPKNLLKIFQKYIAGGFWTNNSEVSAAVSIFESLLHGGDSHEARSAGGPRSDHQLALESFYLPWFGQKTRFSFVSSCNPSCDPFLILCHFFSLCFHPAPPQMSSPLSHLRIRPLSWPGARFLS